MIRGMALVVMMALGLGGSARAEDAGPFDILSHDLRLAIDPAARSVAGRQVIRLRLRKPASEVSFSNNTLEITGAPVRREDGRLIVGLPRAGRAGEVFTLKLAYRGQPRRGMRFEPGLVYTSYSTCEWMVCDIDRPGDKARLRLRLDLPPGYRVVPARPSRAQPAFLQGFAAGELVEASLGQGLRALGVGRTPAELRALFAPTPDMAAFFAEKAGTPLPSRAYWQLLTRSPEAQEGGDFAVIGETVVGPILQTPQEDWAIAHELAHQWWGTLLTCESWTEAWLNEGFAVFMTAAWKEHRWGRAAYDREMDLARRRLAASAAAGFDKPLAWAGAYPNLQIRRGVQYSKGALFLDALRTRLGEAAFWRAVRLYTRAHAGGTVTSADFEAAVERVAPGRAGDLFRTWVHPDP